MNIADWNWFDWLLALIFLASMIAAFMTGLVRAATGLFGFLAGFKIAGMAYDSFGDRIIAKGWVTSEFLARIIAYLVIVMIVVAASEVLGRVLRKSLRAIGLSMMDRILGAAFGLIRGCMIGIAILMAVAVCSPLPDVITKSILRPYLLEAARDVSFVIPVYVQQRIL
jgi:membrane protein required for colicin V production